MRRGRQKPDPERQKALLEKIRMQQAERAAGYREQALKLLPHVCGRCGRAFSGKNLKELTVHHKDHDHFNNPPDGSNWELLCVYCHDDEHQKSSSSGYHTASTRDAHSDGSLEYRPFEGLTAPSDDFQQPRDERSQNKQDG